MRFRNLRILGFVSLTVGISISVLAFGCSDRKSKPTQFKVHPANWRINHPSFIFTNNLGAEYGQACKSCHGTDYTGGTSGVSCVGCHDTRRDSLNRPLFCILCHGDTTDFTGAPPVSLRGKTGDTARGVGAHRAMLYGRFYFAGTYCQTCHTQPPFVLSSTHFTPSGAGADGRAEVVFSGVARLFSSRYGAPLFDSAFGRCSNIYCHGAFPGGDTTHMMNFYGGSGEVFCGSCHAVSSSYASLGGRHATHNPSVDTVVFKCATCHFATVDTSSSPVIRMVNDRPSPNHVNGIFDVEFDPTVAPLGLFDGFSCSGLPDSPGCHANRRDW